MCSRPDWSRLIGSPTVELTFPLSSRYLLRFSREVATGLVRAFDAEVRELNRRSILWADRFVFGESFDTITLRDAAMLSDRRAGFGVVNLDAHEGIYSIGSTVPVHPGLLR